MQKKINPHGLRKFIHLMKLVNIMIPPVKRFLKSKGKHKFLKTYYCCADTLFQETFTINEDGNYYKDYELKCFAFETMIESLSMYDYLKKTGGYQLVYGHKDNMDWNDVSEQKLIAGKVNEKMALLCRELKLTKVEGLWDEITSWYYGNGLFIAKDSTRIKIYSNYKLDDCKTNRLIQIFGEHQQYC